MPTTSLTRAVHIPDGYVQLEGDLHLPHSTLHGYGEAGTSASTGLVIFAHGSGSSRKSRRNREVAEGLAASGFATLLLDLLSAQEESLDQLTHQFRFDVPRLARRVVAAIDWASEEESLPRRRSAPVRLELVPGATHLFEEPGALGRVAHLAAEWFTSHLRRNT